MMAKFRVTVCRKVYASIDLEADSRDEAEKFALGRIEDGELIDEDYEPGHWEILYSDDLDVEGKEDA
jgi:hypothetical protein